MEGCFRGAPPVRAGRLSLFPSCGAGVADEVRSWRALALGRGPRRGFGSGFSGLGFSGPDFSGPGFWRPGLLQPGLWRRKGEAGGAEVLALLPRRRAGREGLRIPGGGSGSARGLRRLRPLPRKPGGRRTRPSGTERTPRHPDRRSWKRLRASPGGAGRAGTSGGLRPFGRKAGSPHDREELVHPQRAQAGIDGSPYDREELARRSGSESGRSSPGPGAPGPGAPAAERLSPPRRGRAPGRGRRRRGPRPGPRGRRGSGRCGRGP